MPSEPLIGLGDTKKAGDGTLSRKSEENRWSEYQEKTGEPIACEDNSESWSSQLTDHYEAWKMQLQQQLQSWIFFPSLSLRMEEDNTEPAKDQSYKDDFAEVTTEKNVDQESLNNVQGENTSAASSSDPKTKKDNTRCLLGNSPQLLPWSLLFIWLLILGGPSLAASRPTTDQASIILDDQISEVIGRKSFLTDATNSSGRANQMCEAAGYIMLTINDINSTQTEWLYYIMKGMLQVWLEHGPVGKECKFLSTKALENGFTDRTSCVRPDDPVGFKAICYNLGLSTESPDGHINVTSTNSSKGLSARRKIARRPRLANVAETRV